MTPEEKQAVLDEEHLRLLALFHYISGGVTVAFSAMYGVMFALAMFGSMLPEARENVDDAAQQLMPQVFGVFGILCAAGVMYGVVEVLAGRFISQRRGRLFIVIASLPRLLFVPYGTILTAFTLLVLDRPSVQELYRRQTMP